MVGHIKANVKALIRFEANDSKEFEEKYLQTFGILRDKNRECQKCNELTAKVEYLTCKLAQVEEKMSRIQEENISLLEQINEKDMRLKKLTNNKLRDEAELKSKLIEL